MKKSCLFGLGLVFMANSAFAQANISYLQEQVDQLKEDMTMVQRQLYRERNDTTAPQESVSNVQVRLGEYDQLIRDINGKVENLEYRINALEKKMEVIEKDIDLRFSQMSKKVGTAAPAPVSRSQVNNKAKTMSAAELKTDVAPKKLYEQALADLKDNKLDDSELKFSQFLNTYPKDALAENAQYWLGEVYYKKQDFAKSAVAFKEGYSKYPEGSKGPDCLLKLGLSMKALGKKEEACTAFVNLPTIFGRVNPEIASRAKDEAKKLSCQ